MPEKQESYVGTCWQINAKFNTRETMESHISRFHYKVTIGTRCHKSPARTKDSMVGGMGRTRAILRRTRRRVLKIEKGDKIR